MKRSLVLGVSLVALGGCAVPVPLQVASWALDGISYLATEKSMTDHGLSVVAQQDCALLRGLTEGSVCKDWDDAATLVADAQRAQPTQQPATKTSSIIAGYAPSANSGIPPLSTDLDGVMPDVEVLANFDTAAGPAEPVVNTPSQPEQVVGIRKSKRTKVPPKQISAPLRVEAPIPVKPAVPVTAQVEIPIIESKPTTALRLAAASSDEPIAGVYYVIGSFRNFGNAQSFAGRHDRFVPDVLAAKLDGAPVYRVVVGPIGENDTKHTFKRMVRSGLRDSWAIRVRPGDWRLARQVIEDKRRNGTVQELARAPR